MAENYYEDAGSEESAASTMAPQSPEESSAQTAVLPVSFFPGDKELEPGNECKVRIVRVHDDSVEVEYVTENKPTEEEPELGEESMPMPPPGAQGMEELMA